MQRLAHAAIACGLVLGAGCGDHGDDRPLDIEYLTATIFQPSCGATQCHSQYARQNGVVLDTPEHVRESVVRKALVTFHHGAYDPDAPEGSKLNIWLTQIQPGGDGTFRMPLDAPLPKKDIALLRSWIADPELLPGVCSQPDPPRDQCGAWRGAGAQCDPAQFNGYACDNFDVKRCGDDWNFGEPTHHCHAGCAAIPRAEYGDDFEKAWCTSVCGDGVADALEPCDDGNGDEFDGCTSVCEIAPVCGDGQTVAPETCDDGNRDDYDGCSPSCQVGPVCGDNNKVAPETCDDGNRIDNDGCSSICQKECGDGKLEGAEQCDDSDMDDFDGCTSMCQIGPVCGDKTTMAPETCDDGNRTDYDGCTSTCQVGPVCGDGMTMAPETCDDGNRTNGDGCSFTCQVE